MYPVKGIRTKNRQPKPSCSQQHLPQPSTSGANTSSSVATDAMGKHDIKRGIGHRSSDGGGKL